MIPWVVALVALFGLNALAPGCFNTKKSESPEGIGLCQPADEVAIPARVSNPLVYCEPSPSDRARFLALFLGLLRIETHRDQPAVEALEGAPQGRAPPAPALA
jgi:hypothetical protein